MMRATERPRLAVTQLSDHHACRHLTTLDHELRRGVRAKPEWQDPMHDVLVARGREHEDAYVEHLRGTGATVVRVGDIESQNVAMERTWQAMASGADLIVQATLSSAGGDDVAWQGRADVLRRTGRPSDLGDWSYEAVETKLARVTRGGTILQLCLYSELIAANQGVTPDHVWVVSPGEPFVERRYRINDFAAYYRRVRAQLETAIGALDRGEELPPTYPEPVPHCDVCRWWSTCSARRFADGHLSLVAGITATQRTELERRGVRTMEALSTMPVPLEWKPERGSARSLEHIREQARVQVEVLRTRRPKYELLSLVPEQGLARLPEPSPGDLFFDIESDRFVDEVGLEYLLGWVTVDDSEAEVYEQCWALARADEKHAFEQFIDVIVERRRKHPDLHVYHYGAYEPAALKRLMGRHGTREDAMDDLLRHEVFVDLHSIVKQSVRAGVDRYSLKNLEDFYGFERVADLRDAASCLRAIERAVELGGVMALDATTRDTVTAYNRDDCVSTVRLRSWLEGLRSDLIGAGESIDRPEPALVEINEALTERQERIAELAERLIGDAPTDPEARTDEQQAQWLLAQLLDWWRREDKVDWWEYFRLRDCPQDAYPDERRAIAEMEHVERLPQGPRKLPVDRYRYPEQAVEIKRGDLLHVDGEQELGEVLEHDDERCTIDVKKRRKSLDLHPSHVFASKKRYSTGALENAVYSLGEWVASHGVEAASSDWAAALALLRRCAPRCAVDRPLVRTDEEVLDAAKRAALELDGEVLAIQGPPGTGKTYAGARMILAAVQAGKKVGVTATGHKVIDNLLREVCAAASSVGVDVSCLHKHKEDHDVVVCVGLRRVTAYQPVDEGLANGAVQVVGGTAWCWAREEARGVLDVLFIDEAGQMSLADTLAAAGAARNLVLLGDPQQLEQPQQGSHPEGTDVSALEHILGSADGVPNKTLSDERGLFLAETWRLHPSICAFTSELFYEDRLRARPTMARQEIVGDTRLAGTGLWFAPVDHAGNRNTSREEVAVVAELVGELIGGVDWVDADGARKPLRIEDVLIVAPYNAHVDAIVRALPEGARVGTVDKFQGQEAPVVIYAMGTSTPDDAPRGMRFLYSLDRLNVATSRARCACVLVASPALLDATCGTPQQMMLANGLCLYVEMARVVALPAPPRGQ